MIRVSINIQKPADAALRVETIDADGQIVDGVDIEPGHIENACEFEMDTGHQLSLVAEGVVRSARAVDDSELKAQLELANARIVELETANAQAKARAVKQRGTKA